MKQPWTSFTDCFFDDEITNIQDIWENNFEAKMIPTLLGCNPIVTLRAIAEIILNVPDATTNTQFEAILQDEPLSQHWAKFTLDPELDNFDYFYAMQIMDIMKKFDIKLAQKQALEIIKHKPELLDN